MKTSGLLRSTAVFSAMTLLSRIAGFVRDMVQANLFGAGGIVDAFAVAYRIPNYLRRIFAEGSFASAFVPVLSELRQKNDPAALKDFLDHVAGALCATVLVVSGLGMLAAPLVVALIAPGSLDNPEKFELTSHLLRIVFPYLALVSMTALAGAVLNSFQRFALPAVTPVLHNLAVIAAMVWLSPLLDVPITALAWGVLAAGVLQLVLLWPAMGRLGLRPRLRLKLKHPGVVRVGKLMLPTLFSSSVAQLNLIVGTMFASLLVDGSQSWLYYSDRLVEFPLGLFGVALATVILPHLSRRSADGDGAGYADALDWGLRTVLLVAVPAALGLALLAEPLSITMFERGEFVAADSRMTALSLVAMSLGIPGFMASKVLLSAFYARQDTRTPMRAAVKTVFINVALTAALVTPLWLGGVPGAHAGIALATGLAGLANAWLLWGSLKRDSDFTLSPGWGRHLLRIIFASAALAGAVLLASHLIGDWRAWSGSMRWVLLLAVVAAGAAGYGLALLASGWRPRELRGP
ncbi:MAG: murein biosynthesis integral membrane protein MurJ [Arenimonas sp.]|uniref:murein biosynthesis integral membrane protein MurJ n=1 Tax=Arenimonas sp. TaxID=1872635 RepID=UPI0025B8366A|nr:murein biosynthesis integral membrane protein MurJ [Arenimonas sp.]MBW8367612.1 murein biosynthesis integral membrane protein MurJ [Arenimonas sp.]